MNIIHLYETQNSFHFFESPLTSYKQTLCSINGLGYVEAIARKNGFSCGLCINFKINNINNVLVKCLHLLVLEELCIYNQEIQNDSKN